MCCTDNLFTLYRRLSQFVYELGDVNTSDINVHTEKKKGMQLLKRRNSWIRHSNFTNRIIKQNENTFQHYENYFTCMHTKSYALVYLGIY